MLLLLTPLLHTAATAPDLPLLAVGNNASQPVWRAGLFAPGMTAKGTLNAPVFDVSVLKSAVLPLAAWEDGFTVESLGTNVVRDPASGKIRMYYTLRWAALDAHGVPVTHTDPQPHMFAIAMAESDDGITFTKPALPSKPYNNTLNGVNVSASNIICADQCLSSIWITDKGPTSDQYWGAAGGHGGGGGDAIKIWSSKDGIEWSIHGSLPIPRLNGMRGLDTMQSMFYDPGCQCHALYTRLWWGHSPGNYTGAYRMVRRANIALSGPLRGPSAHVTKQAIVLQADAIDLASHTPVLDFPAVGFYGATSWVRDYGGGQMGYFMAPERYWHWQGGNARPGEGGEPATYDIPLLVSNDGWNFSYLGDRQPIARPTLDSGIGNSRLWFTAPITSGDEELIYLTRGNMNEDGEVAPSTDGSKLAYKSEIALARIRIDGLYSLDSPYGHTANATTVPLLFNKGSEISLNVDASAGGSVTVAVMSPDGKRLLLGPSMPYTHSSIRARVQWPVNAGHPAGATVLAGLAGQPVVLHFEMEEAKLFSFRIHG